MKRIITISYYADFSRFFYGVLRGVEGVSVTNLCLYPSAMLFDFCHNRQITSIFLPREVRKNTKANVSNIYDLYVEYYRDLVRKLNPDLVISAGDSRVAVEALVLVAKEQNINL